MWHIELRCTICGPLGVFFDLLPDIFSDDFLKQTNKKGLQEACSLVSAPVPKAQVHYCDNALSVVCLTVVVKAIIAVTFVVTDFLINVPNCSTDH